MNVPKLVLAGLLLYSIGVSSEVISYDDMLKLTKVEVNRSYNACVSSVRQYQYWLGEAGCLTSTSKEKYGENCQKSNGQIEVTFEFIQNVTDTHCQTLRPTKADWDSMKGEFMKLYGVDKPKDINQ